MNPNEIFESQQQMFQFAVNVAKEDSAIRLLCSHGMKDSAKVLCENHPQVEDIMADMTCAESLKLKDAMISAATEIAIRLEEGQ